MFNTNYVRERAKARERFRELDADAVEETRNGASAVRVGTKIKATAPGGKVTYLPQNTGRSGVVQYVMFYRTSHRGEMISRSASWSGLEQSAVAMCADDMTVVRVSDGWEPDYSQIVEILEESVEKCASVGASAEVVDLLSGALDAARGDYARQEDSDD